jgi:hypothetical protein
LKKRKRRQGNEGRKEKDKYPTVVVFVLSSLLPLLLQSGKRNRIKVTFSPREHERRRRRPVFSPSMLQGVPKRLALLYGLLSMIHWIIPSLKLDGAGGGADEFIWSPR